MFKLAKLAAESKRCVSMFWKLGIVFSEAVERNSGQWFLWVLRNPPLDNEKDPNLDELLPKGFLERTKDKGLW